MMKTIHLSSAKPPSFFWIESLVSQHMTLYASSCLLPCRRDIFWNV